MKKSIVLLLSAALLVSCATGGKNEKVTKEFDQLVQQVKQEFAPDRRDKTFEPQLVYNEENKSYAVKGSTTEAGAVEALVSALKEKGIEAADSMVVLPDPLLGDKTYGITAQSVINLRYGPGYSNESATQTLMGMPVRILEKKGGWTRCITPEGYTAWVSSGSIQPMNSEEYNEWTAAPKLIVTTHYTLFREAPVAGSPVISDGVWGNIVRNEGKSGNSYKVILPNGRVAYVAANDVQEFDKWLGSRNPTAENILAVAKQFLGFPYMWGGTSVKAMDCSGFTKTAFYLNGVILERDASQQARTGADVDITGGFDNLRAGDLLFFGSKATEERKERITHVGIYIGNGEFIHSATSVRINSLIPDSVNYYEGSNRLVRANRLITEIDKDPGIVSIVNHPWYFVK
ncbi:MAG: glycoside hydrolase [Bacteroidia bacterium]|jgi:cell wall-associated NlpC family hydrolase|nr:glycoside hydrolase [Bacteroidia bacterium]